MVRLSSPPPHPRPNGFSPPRLALLGSRDGRGKPSRLQPEPAAATWVGRGGTGAGKAGPGEGGGAGAWELGRRTLENRGTHEMIQGSIKGTLGLQSSLPHPALSSIPQKT